MENYELPVLTTLEILIYFSKYSFESYTEISRIIEYLKSNIFISFYNQT